MRVIVAGSRNISNYEIVRHAIEDSDFDITEIVSGTAKGVDRLGEHYARLWNIPIKQFPADWDKYGKKAGIIRNHQMGRYADALIAVWDGKSKGTFDMIQFMSKLHKPVYLVTEYADNEWIGGEYFGRKHGDRDPFGD
jgi:hypothetical protein